jgi:5-methylcytosine-specific restriction protein B
MAKEIPRRRSPLGPLLAQYKRERGLAPAFSERAPFRIEDLQSAPDEILIGVLRSFGEQLPLFFHASVHARQLPFIRYSIEHLFHGHDPLSERLARCVTPGEAYYVPGLGPGFWSLLASCAGSDELPFWCPAV